MFWVALVRERAENKKPPGNSQGLSVGQDIPDPYADRR
jgi:hypothetical protein